MDFCGFVDSFHNILTLCLVLGVVGVVNSTQFPFSYVHTESCGDRSMVFRSFGGISLYDCLAECGLRPKCVALNHRQPYDNLCELLENTNVVSDRTGCLYIRRGNIDFNSQYLMDCSCTPGEMCDKNSGICSRQECDPVRTINSGMVTGNKFSIGSSYRISCDDLYEPQNNVSVATCMHDGMWNAIPSCVLKECTPFSITDGQLQGSVFTIWANVVVSCNTGYVEENGITMVTCLPTTQWNYRPVCILNQCAAFTIDNGNLLGSDYSVGATLTVSCDDGYEEQNTINTVNCLSTREWDYQPVCVVQPCPSSWTRLDDFCFYLSTGSDGQFSWSNSRSQCENKQGHLAVLDTQQKNQFIRTELYHMGYPGDYGYWIDLKKVSGSWEWTTINTYMTYEDWAGGQPEEKGEKCVYFWNTDRHWHDAGCSWGARYICEKAVAT